jgi:hypothetical protein
MYSLYNIEKWTTAIYAEKFPEAIPHLAKHAEIVREMVKSQNSNAWFVYDQRVRMDRQGRLHPQLRNVLSLVTKVPEKLLSLALVAMI